MNAPLSPTIRKAKCVRGRRIVLRNAKVEDSAYILGLRTDDKLAQHLSRVDASLDQQEAYMRRYENGDGQAYFVICDLDGKSWGTVRIYDQIDDSFCWGSWIVQTGAPAAAAIETVLLVYFYAFDVLQFSNSHFDVRQDNESVWRFHERFGARLVRQTDLDRYYTLTKQQWSNSRLLYARYLTETDPEVIFEEDLRRTD